MKRGKNDRPCRVGEMDLMSGAETASRNFFGGLGNVERSDWTAEGTGWVGGGLRNEVCSGTLQPGSKLRVEAASR